MTVDDSHNKKFWHLITVHVAREAEELATSCLFDLGTTGTVTLEESEANVKIGAYFDASADLSDLAQQIDAEFARAGNRQALLGISFSEIPEQDWMQKWKEGFEPLAVGSRLMIAPFWKLPADTEGRAVIQVDPGMAFGTGTHETTRLCLQALETYWHGGALLDVGTGTGILAIAAALLESGSQITAIDIDPVAVDVAGENIVINHVENLVTVCEGQPADYVGRDFDAVVANLTAEVIIDLIKELAGCLRAGGVMILSGILTTLRDGVEQVAKAAGLEIVERGEAGEWSLVVARKGAR